LGVRENFRSGIVVIDNIQGIEQGLNPRTLDFTGIAGVSFYADGVKVAEDQNIYTSNIIRILSQVIDKSMECAYGATGFLLAPWVVIKNDGCLGDIS
jgi:aromatic ring hydroxylase